MGRYLAHFLTTGLLLAFLPIKIVGGTRGTPDISFVAQVVDVYCCLQTDSGKTNQFFI